MWISASDMTYKCKAALARELESVTHWYEYYSPVIGDPSLPQSHMFDKNLWFTGISSNPVMSLKAHNVDLKNKLEFICTVVSVKNAAEIKLAVMSLSYFDHCSENSSDYIYTGQQHTYMYSFLVKEDSVFKISTEGFTPLKYMPASPAEFYIYPSNGTRKKKIVSSENRDNYPQVIADLLRRCRKGGIDKIILRSPRYHRVMLVSFDNGQFDVYYDPKTAVGGFVQRLALREGTEDPWGTLEDIILCFLKNDDNYKKVKWKSYHLEIEI